MRAGAVDLEYIISKALREDRTPEDFLESIDALSISQIDLMKALYNSALKYRRRGNELREEAFIDDLTSLYNRRAFNRDIATAYSKGIRNGYRPFLVLFDLDHFKRINDTYGHQIGDDVLSISGRLFRRHEDRFYRYGGEEFAAILDSTPSRRNEHEDNTLNFKQLFLRIEDMRDMLKGSTFRSYDGDQIEVTMSYGVAPFDPSFETPEFWIRRADLSLMAAKENGRDRGYFFDLNSGSHKPVSSFLESS